MIRILGKIENNILPAIETDRLYLRQRLVADAADVFEYAKLAEVSYPAGFPPVATLEDEIYYIENILPKRFEEQNIPSGYGITLEGEDKVIGSIDFNHRHADDVLEIGYLLHPDYWNQGIVTEAAQALLEIGFTLLNLHKIEISCYDYNIGSRRVAEKLGFTLEATIRDRKDAQGNRCADLRYGLLKSEWENLGVVI
ncbi:TPA: GNAT family N-acetyltransferase [Streptococcus suis]|nr:GNAT family N-acetyltransferase [Streptococcus suis]NQM13405.1 GNAT family N-acetyltransferase [Streptococcus suis]HEM3560489.1 GNAT family N-acetyltransferase [Streptococcus suis]